MDTTIHTVTVTADGEDHHFASLDGEHYIGVSRLPVSGEAEQIGAMVEGDGNFRPMTIGRGWFSHLAEERGDTVTFGEV